MEHKNLKLAVKNFGPIREGEVEFKPLTVFIGPNNSGKSYMATLLYALIQALTGKRGYPLTRFEPFDLSSDDVDAITEWSNKLSNGSIQAEDKLTHRVRFILRERFDAQRRGLEVYVPDAFREYFGCTKLDELSYRGLTEFLVNLFEEDSDTPLISIREGCGSRVKINVEQDISDIVQMEIPRIIDPLTTDSALPTLLPFLLWKSWLDKLTSMGMPKGNAFYLPAGRSGLLQGWQLAASFAVGMLGPRIGTQNFEIPSFPGVSRDFTQQILRMMPPSRDNKEIDELTHAIRLMEEKIIHGKIDVRANNNMPDMAYESKGVHIPIQRVSSMISELAPIYLWMNYLLKRDDALIIDEPEAYLHPENQRLIAQVLVRLMNAGVRVVCTTHSSLILHQLSNQILATSSGRLDEVGFTEHDRLSLEDIGVYLFEPGEDGVYVKEVEVDSDFGISEDEFVRVADQIGDETYQLVT